MKFLNSERSASGISILLTGAFAAVLLAGGVWAGSSGLTRDARFTLTSNKGSFSLQADGASLKDVLRKFEAVAGVRLTIDSQLDERVTADLKNVTAEEMLKALTKSGALVYEKDGKGGYRLASASATSQQKLPASQNATSAQQDEQGKPFALAKGQLSNVKNPTTTLLKRNSRSILLENAIIDSTALLNGSKLQIPDALKSKGDEKNYIVQLDHPVSVQDRAAISNAGGLVGHYIPNNALFVRVADASLVSTIEKIPGVAVVEPYQPYYKLSRDIVASSMGLADAQEQGRAKIGKYNVMFVDDKVDASSTLGALVATVDSRKSSMGRTIVSISADAANLNAIAANTDVLWIEPAMPLQPMNDLAGKRIHGAQFRKLHPTLTGSGVIVGVTDTGVDYQHAGFSLNPAQPTSTNVNTRIVNYHYASGGPTSDGLPGDTVGHGTHVAGSILGNGGLSLTVNRAPGSGTAPYATNQFAGVAPGARLVMVEDFNSFSYQQQLTLSYNAGARMNNNSWGANISQYNIWSAEWDTLVADMDAVTPGAQQFISFFAAGNSGNGNDNGLGGTTYSVGTPGNAKNVITVGSVELARFAENYPNARAETDSEWQIASYSSRGPISPTDQRRKPDVVAPGSYVLSVQSRDTNPDDLVDPLLPDRDYRYGNLDSGTNYAFMSGTSMATPITTGAGALLFEAFTNKYGRAPSPAMMKALLVNGARNINSLVYPKQSGPFVPNSIYMEAPVYQGYGLVDVIRSADGPLARSTDRTILLDEGETTPATTDSTYTYPVIVKPGDGGLKVTLAYTDSAGTPGNARALVNDLDLFVVAPNGVSYLGNVYSYDGVHSMPLSGVATMGADGFNNVEQVIVPEPLPGTYYIRVYGWNIPGGAQPFALSVMTGLGIEGRVPGNSPAVALDTNNNPVVAYSGPDTGGNEQIFVRKWSGALGDNSTFGQWIRLEDQWSGIRDSANQAGYTASNGAATGISRTLEPSRNPSVAVDGDNVYVAWEEHGQTTNYPTRIFLKKFNGTDWVELGSSARYNGIVGSLSPFDSFDPVVKVVNHLPVVAWRQVFLGSTKAVVAYWTGSSWAGLGGSYSSNGIPGSQFVADLDMAVDSTGAIVIAWQDSDLVIHVKRWFSNSWNNLGSGVQGSSTPIASEPSLAVDNSGGIYLAWIQGTATYPNLPQVYASKFQSGAWQAIGGSTNYPGVSVNTDSTNSVLSSPSIAIGRNNEVILSWVAGNADENAVLAKKFNGTQWSGLSGAGSRPGVGLNGGTSARAAMVSDANSTPIIAFDTDESGTTEVMTYAVSSDRKAPSFLGIQFARGNTNNGVVVGWSPAVDASSNIAYKIYRSPASVPCGSIPVCDPISVFGNLIATVTNQVDYAVGGLTNGRTYCFGVRAMDEEGYIEQNTILLAAGPNAGGAGDDDGDCIANALELQIGTDTCLKDSDSDGMWDGWEWAFSTNNLAHTNTLAMSALDNGIDNIRTATIADGNPSQYSLADLDGDGLSNFDEFNWWYVSGAPCPPSASNSPDPTRFDTDGDGMGDGWEVRYSLSPISTNGINGANGDPDADGVPNIVEYQYGTNPRVSDSDGDGLTDLVEIYTTLSDPLAVDSDQDGLDDGVEVGNGTNPAMADSATNSLLSDGDAWQLGWTNRAQAITFDFMVREDFETSSRTNWTHQAIDAALPFDLWRLSAADPAPAATNHPAKITFMYQRTTNVAYRMARDPSATATVPGTNLNADYNVGLRVQCGLMSPTFSTLTNSCVFIQWNEYFETEPFNDLVQIQARDATTTNWIPVGQQFSGMSTATNPYTRAVTNGWAHRMADLSRFVGLPSVQVRFVFTDQNGINNNRRGWWVDDVYIYGGVVISGWVRDVRGRPVDGGQVYAIGLGGVTNIVEGHKVSGTGKMLKDAKTSADGSYLMAGLPHGQLLIKAVSAGLAAEFFNGPLFSGTYAFGAGLTNNFGLSDATLAKSSPNGIVNVISSNRISNIFFELDQGKGRAYIGVAGPSAALKLDNQAVSKWNGSTSTAAYTTWSTVPSVGSLTNNRPDWETAPSAPTLMGDAAPGMHWLSSSLGNFPPQAVIQTREGEDTLVQILTNQQSASLYVTATISGTYSIWLDGNTTTNVVPATIAVKAGTHYVTLVPQISSSADRPAVMEVVAMAGALPTRVQFSTNELAMPSSFLSVNALDIHGNAISGAQIYVNGSPLSSNDVVAGNALTTPTTIRGLLAGRHYVSVSASGYQQSEVRVISAFSGSSNSISYTMYDADRDYDHVGDATEIIGYTNVFLYTRSSDPDADGLNNAQEYALFRDFNVRINPFNPDSDADGLSDGAEVGYDGMPGVLALTELATNVVQDASWVVVHFSGKYLAGIEYFKQSNAVASIDGDRFDSPRVMHPLLPVPNREWTVSLFTNIVPLVHDRAVSSGHNRGTVVYSDTRPDKSDTDGDGMWDGFEVQFATMQSLADPNTTIRILDPIETGSGDSDPDGDGLTTYQEFLGSDGVRNLLWSDPTKADSDGDGIPDGWETQYGQDPSDPSDAMEDPDGDGLINLGEYLYGCNPNAADTDADFLSDAQEVFVFHSDPRSADTDNDGLADGREVWDKNLDGIADGGFFPMWNGEDLDGDGYVDGPTDWDTDGDGMPDGFEVLDNWGRVRSPSLDPYNPFDGAIDSDNDGLSNLQEYLVQDGLYGNTPGSFDPVNFGYVIWQYPTDPFSADSDNDGMPDGFEVLYGLGPVDPSPNSPTTSATLYPDLLPEGDTDYDGLWNDREYRIRFHLSDQSPTNPATSLSTSPWNPDTDGDGLGDGEEDRIYRANPVLQDSDGDRLTDGVSYPGKPAEVESVSRISEYQFVPGAISWQAAVVAAHVPHPAYPWIFGRLATLTDTQELANAIAAIGAANNVAVGGWGLPVFDYHWITYEGPTPAQLFALPFIPPGSPTNFLMLNADSTITLTTDIAAGGYLIEWENVPQSTAHYDGSTNDLWALVWPAADNGVVPTGVATPSLPYWVKIEPDDGGGLYPAPEPRWGHVASYIPVIEEKNSSNPRTPDSQAYRMLMDNRRFVTFGGNGGVSRYRDVWEYSVASNRWEKSLAPLNSEVLGGGYFYGLSESAAFTRFITANTRAPDCPCANVPYNCSGQGFGEPKNRPWSDRSYDITYLFAGQDTYHYYYNGGYGNKGSDDMRSITERSSTWDSAGYVGLTIPAGNLNTLVDANPAQIRIGKNVIVVINNVTNNLQGYAGFTINPMPFFSTCEIINHATLRLNIGDAPAADMPVTLLLEVNNNQDHAEAYPGGARPDQRVVSGANFRSTPQSITIPAGFTGIIPIDVTTQFIQVIESGTWDASRMGFLITNQTDTTDFAAVRQGDTVLEVTYTPSYKQPPTWPDFVPGAPGLANVIAGLPTNAPGVNIQIFITNTARKGSAIAYDYPRDRYLVFGGIDGRAVIGNAVEFQINPGAAQLYQAWAVTEYASAGETFPPARWGHSMIFDKKHNWYMVFGGYDQNHNPLNDLWIYIPDGNDIGLGGWVQVPRPAGTDQWPRPRGGHSMVYFGDFDYNRGIGEYCVGKGDITSYNAQKVVLFGGTDGKTFFNDTWVFDGDTLTWTLVNPSGIWAANSAVPSPSPRAFASMVYAQNLGGEILPTPTPYPTYCAYPAIMLFGGSVGTKPTSRDTDFDMVDDGVEHELNGASQRDPRFNKMFMNPFELNPPPETLPFNFIRMGSVPPGWDPAFPNFIPRGAVADFESQDYSNGVYALNFAGLPYETHPYNSRVNATLVPGYYDPGVDANIVGQTWLWYHKYGGEDQFDVRDVWQLGQPNADIVGTNHVPAYAYSGRWCYGTKLDGYYPRNAVMELYSPLVHLNLPVADSTAANPNLNNLYLVFHEWLDLASSNDAVRIDLLRPVAGSDIMNRKTGVNKPIIRVLPDRNNSQNSTSWRRMIVPLNMIANETNVYFRFTLQSSTNAGLNGGGWYIDDVAIIQGATLSGWLTNAPNTQVALMGINSMGTAYTNVLTDSAGYFQFGLLPDGDYQIGTGGGIIGALSVGDTSGWNGDLGVQTAPTVSVSSIVPNPGGGNIVSWPTTPGLRYRLEYSDDFMVTWYPLVTVVAAGQQESYIDYDAVPVRMYRVVFLNNL